MFAFDSLILILGASTPYTSYIPACCNGLSACPGNGCIYKKLLHPCKVQTDDLLKDDNMMGFTVFTIHLLLLNR